jgi:hypothetical protein
MDPKELKQEPVAEMTVLSSLPPANNITISENPENAEGNTATDKNPQNAEGNTAADKNPQNAIGSAAAEKKPENAVDTKSFGIKEAEAFTKWLRDSGKDSTEVRNPIVLAEANWVSLAEGLNADLANLSLVDRDSRKDEVFKAEKEYKEKLAEQKALVKEQRRKDFEEQIDKEEDDSELYDAISEGKVWAKLKVGYTDCAMVELRAVDKKTGKYEDRCSIYQVFDADLVDQTQLANAPNYSDIRLKKISRAQASLAFAAAYRGGPDTVLSTFDIEDFLAKKLPKKSSPDVVPRESRRTIWMMGDLEVPEKTLDGNLVHKKVWMMPRSDWEGMKPSKDKKKIYEWGVGRAIRQFRNYHNRLNSFCEIEESEFEPEKTPFSRANSESANDWRVPEKTPEPQGTPDRDFSEPPRDSSLVTERSTPAPVSGGGSDTEDEEMIDM